jgi:exopolysaccharide biosynthesis protein
MANYSFIKDNGIVLNVIKTSPNNIALKAINSNVTATTLYGINGGFFYGTDILSIAVNNDVPVKGVAGSYGCGWFNEKYKRGTLVWDKVASAYSVQVAGSATELQVTDRGSYWAQGGISMRLQNDIGWYDQASAEGMPNIDGKTTRTALVYNSGLNIWLVVTETLCTAEAFRRAIKGQIGSGTMVDGIFLDGGGSSQMQCTETEINGDGRTVRQMVALINN